MTTLDQPNNQHGHRRLWRLSAPVMLANITTPLLGLVDTAVVGHLDAPSQLGGVAVGSLIFSFLFWGFGFLRMGTTGLSAQAAGAGRWTEVRAVLLRALSIGGIAALTLLILQTPIRQAALSLAGTSPEVSAQAAAYFGARIWAAPATLANYALLGWFLGVQRPRYALLMQVMLNLLNIVLDLLFVLGLGLGVAGVGAASALAEWTALGLGLLLAYRLAGTMPGEWALTALRDSSAWRRLLSLNTDLFIRTLSLIGAFAWFTRTGTQLGDVILAANAVLLNFQTLMAYALDAFAHASEILVGHAVGAGDRRALRESVRVSALWSALFAGAFSLGYFAGGEYLIAMLTDLEAVKATAAVFLPYAALSPLFSVASYQLDGVFLGATQARIMRNCMILSLALFLVLSLLLVPWFGNHGLWSAFLIFMALRGITLALRYPVVERNVAA